MHEAVVFRTRNLGKRYKNRWAVNDVNLEVRRGEVFGFLGPNGAGKSTTIRMMLSLVRPTRGEIFLFEKPLHAFRREVLSRVGGLVESADFYLYVSARRNLNIVAALRGGSSEQEIEEVLEIVGLRDRADDKVKTFSHGMRQRLGIAQALLGSPEFIVLDEPTSGLDPQGIKEVRELIRRLSVERSITVFLSSHLLSEIEHTATSMAIINRGELVVQGNVRELLNSGPSIVQIDAEPSDTAFAILQRHQGVQRVTKKEEMLEVAVQSRFVAELNTLLVAEGVRVRALIPKRSLEDYFLSITENHSEVVHARRGM